MNPRLDERLHNLTVVVAAAPTKSLASQAQEAAFTTREAGKEEVTTRGWPTLEIPSTTVVKRSQSAACAQYLVRERTVAVPGSFRLT
jgi:hypothetical protein